MASSASPSSSSSSSSSLEDRVAVLEGTCLSLVTLVAKLQRELSEMRRASVVGHKTLASPIECANNTDTNRDDDDNIENIENDDHTFDRVAHSVDYVEFHEGPAPCSQPVNAWASAPLLPAPPPPTARVADLALSDTMASGSLASSAPVPSSSPMRADTTGHSLWKPAVRHHNHGHAPQHLLHYNAKNVTVTFSGGRGFGNILFNSSIFVIASIQGCKFITSTKRAANPQWNELWYVYNVSTPFELQLEVFEKTALVVTKCSTITKSGIDTNGTMSLPIPGTQKSIDVEITLGTVTDDFNSTFAFTHNAFKMHVSSMAGIITFTSRADGSLPGFTCYSIEMFHVPSIFHDTWQAWNREYANARAIFGQEEGSATLRQAIRVQFAALYREGLLRTRTGRIQCANDFFELLDHGCRNGMPQFFTYVLTDERFRFSESGIEFTKDFFSKHSMHSNCAEQVRYAGEFHIRAEANGSFTLVLDNNSGTYSPKPQHLPLLQRAFKANFPFMQVECLERNDPRVLEAMDHVKHATAR